MPSARQSLTEDKLITYYVEYLIDNLYVNVGNKVYRQCVGIPLGTDCAQSVPVLLRVQVHEKLDKQRYNEVHR